MTSIPQYVTVIRDRQRIIARKLGCDPMRADKQTRAINLASIIIAACVLKAIVDKGLISDAEVLAVFNAARDAIYDDEPMVTPDDTAPQGP